VSKQPCSAALFVEKLEVNYGSKNVLKGLDLSVQSGETFGLLGPNGSGKTTLIRSICGRIKPASGTIRIAGEPNTNRRALRNIGLVPQEIALYEHLTARENLVTFGRLSGLSYRETLAALPLAVEATKLSRHVDDFVSTLSGGWQRRVNIAAAILHRPSLLILDEPMVGVDIDARNALQLVIRDLSGLGLAVLLVTHDLDQAEALCSRVGFLRHGRLDPVGRPADLLNEAFDGHHEVRLELREPAPGAEHEALVKLGLSECASGLEWRGMIAADPGDQPGLSEALNRSNLDIKEIRYRTPGLDSLFTSLTKERPTH
jgi:ABC-2 type transport system ATP-binding protein